MQPQNCYYCFQLWEVQSKEHRRIIWSIWKSSQNVLNWCHCSDAQIQRKNWKNFCYILPQYNMEKLLAKCVFFLVLYYDDVSHYSALEFHNQVLYWCSGLVRKVQIKHLATILHYLASGQNLGAWLHPLSSYKNVHHQE